MLEPGLHAENITTLLLFVIAIASFADMVIGAGILWAWWLMAGVSIAGMGVVLIAMRILLRRLWSGNWRAVEGVILWARVDEYHGRHGTDYMPVVRYRFEAAGVPFEGDRIWIGPRQRSSKEAARRTLESYRRSATVMVSYDPSDPTDCVLERRIGAWFQVTMMFVLSSLVLIFTLLALVRLPRGC